MFDRQDLQRIAISALGAIILSTAAVAAAVGPAVDMAPIGQAQVRGIGNADG